MYSKTRHKISNISLPPGMNKDDTRYVDLLSDSDSTLLSDSQAPQHIGYHESSDDERNVPVLEKTAENGWIQIFMIPQGPYDFDNDPAGFYGGREVDDRPSLIEFYRQDARTNGFFARVAPTKAERVAAAEAKVDRNLAKSNKNASTMSGRSAPQNFASIAQWSYASVLMGSTSKRGSGTKKTLPLPSYPREESAKEHALGLVDTWTKVSKARIKQRKDADAQKAIDTSLALSRDKKANSEFDHALRHIEGLKKREDLDLRQAFHASREIVEVEDGSDPQKQKRSGNCRSISDGFCKESDSTKAPRHSSI